ncbi:MAG: penicillin-binding protein 2 [Candidatus Omnitrophica bacterium]|nr:penicillin-binding protein 2 [Candidatus Omnitrophota bacterium]
MYSYSVFVDPALIENPSQVISCLSSKLNILPSEIASKISAKKRFVWIKRKISLKEKEEIKALKLKGVGFIREQKRYYPQENLASTVLGIVDIDNKGLDGIELSYDNYLRSKQGWFKVLQDSRQKKVFLSSQIITPKDGADIVLTIDAQIQYFAEKYLFETIKKFSAKEGSIIVMDANSGEILALANYPSFNPNKRTLNANYRNYAIVDMFEPGSIFKIVTLIAAIEKNIFKDDDKIFCENGEFKIPGSTLHDWKPYGFLTFREVFKKSSNIGVAKIANKLGAKILYENIKRLGFGHKTGIDLKGEVLGKVKPPANWSKTSSYIIPIGQEISVTLIQLVRAFAVVANGGYLVKPHLVKKIYSPFFTKEIQPEREKILPTRLTERAKDILISVVEDGTGVLAKIDGFKVGGKTGTAQQFDPKIGQYSPTEYRASFIGFVSDYEPTFVIGVSIYAPKTSHFGGVVAAPLFKKVAEKTLMYFESKNLFRKNNKQNEDN